MEDAPDHVFRAVAEQLDMGLVILDADDKVVYWNRFMASHGRPEREPVGHNLFEVFPELPAGVIRRKLALVRTLGAPAFTSWRERPQLFPLFHGRTFTGGDGVLRQDISIFPVPEPGGTPRFTCIAAYDVSEVAAKETALRDLNEQLLQSSRTDVLTGLNNRREIERFLRREEDDARRYGGVFSVLLIDVDHFKQVNDTYGHAAGDEALRQMGRILTEQLRRPDVAARFGGEEFLVCLPRAGGEEAVMAGERLRAEVEKTRIVSPASTFPMTISVGVAEWNNGLDNYLQLLVEADKALYAAKRGGRNRVVLGGAFT